MLLNAYTGWPFRLCETSRWHQNKSSVFVRVAYTKTQHLFLCQRKVWHRLNGRRVSLSPVWSRLLMPGPEGVQHLMLHDPCRNTPRPLEVQLLLADTQPSNIRPASRAGPFDVHKVGLSCPWHPFHTSIGSRFENWCSILDDIFLCQT